MWPFRKKAPRDLRCWNEDWRVGDTAECIVGPQSAQWFSEVKPWNRPALRQQFIVTGFRDEIGADGNYHYLLDLKGWPVSLSTTAFRKVRTTSVEQSEVVERILKAKPGKDRVRKPTPQTEVSNLSPVTVEG